MTQLLVFPIAVAVALVGPTLSTHDIESSLPSTRLDPAVVLEQARAGSFSLTLLGTTFQFHVAPDPIAEGAVWGLDGVVQGVITDTVTFRGTANGFDATVAATGVGVFAMIMTPDPILLEPAWLTQPDAPLDLHRVGTWSQNPPVIVDEEPELPEATPASVTMSDGGAGRTARFLLESDFSFYKQFSLMGACNACALQVQQTVLSFANALWNQSDVGVEFKITSQWLCTTATSCPYQDSGAINEMGRWLTLFRNRWEAVANEPPHDVGHIMIGTNLPQWTGLAGGLATTPDGYSLSEILGVLPTTGMGPYYYAIVAHELGHNLNGVHIEADPIPPALVPTGAFGVMVTIMWPNWPVQWQFSDGSWDPAHNNRARIVSAATSLLPT